MTFSATVLYGRESFCEVQKLWSGSLSECSLSECHPRHLTVQSLDNTTTHEQLSLNNATTQEKCIGTAAQNPAVAIARPSYIARPSPLEGLLTRQRAHGAHFAPSPRAAQPPRTQRRVVIDRRHRSPRGHRSPRAAFRLSAESSPTQLTPWRGAGPCRRLR